jgi:hypothetical protein
MPTTITAQNGAQIKQETRLTISGCAVAEARRCVKILTRKIVRDVLTIRVRTCAAGRLTARGKNLRTAARSLRKAATLNVKMALSRSGVRTLRRSHRLKVRVRVVFVPTKKGPHASASTTVAFKH